MIGWMKLARMKKSGSGGQAFKLMFCKRACNGKMTGLRMVARIQKSGPGGQELQHDDL